MTVSSRQQAWADLQAAVDAQVRAAYAIGPGAVVSVVRTLLAQYEQSVAAELVGLEARLAALAADVAALKAAAAKDSRNSGKPPSSDVTRTGRAPKSLRGTPGTSGKPSGGQPGHPGTTLALRARPDAVVVHGPAACAACGHDFAAGEGDPSAVSVVGERRQVFELPPLALVCTEHQVHERRCPRCATLSRGTFPSAVRTTVQYGPGVLALGVALTAQHLLPVQRAADIVSALIGQRLSPATLLAAEGRVQATLAPVIAHIHAGLTRAPVVHFDETGFFVARQHWWLHVACTPTLTLYTTHPRRGTRAHDAIGLLPTYAGVALHDAYSSYFPYTGCQHALCGVHLQRELLFLAEDCGSRWARALGRALETMRRTTVRARAAGQAALPARTCQRYERRVTALLATGLAAEPPPTRIRASGKPRRTPSGQVLERLRRHRAAVLRFVHDLRVPFDNSEAERDLRMMKVEQKVSGGFRTVRGAHTFCTLRSYLVTARKQGVAALDALHRALTGQPFLPAVP
jgi:transposase